MNSTAAPLKFASLVGHLDNAHHSRVLQEFQTDLLDFDEIHLFANEKARTVAERLHESYGSETIIDYGDEPAISDFHSNVFAKLLSNVELKYPAFKSHYEQLFRDVCQFTEKSWLADDTLTKARHLRDLLRRTEDLLVFALMNAEIAEAIYKLHLQKFGRPFWKPFFDYSTPKSQVFSDFFFHGVLVGISRHLKFLVREFRRQQPQYDPRFLTAAPLPDDKTLKLDRQLTENRPLLDVPSPDDPFRDLYLHFMAFEQSLKSQDDLIATYAETLSTAVLRMPVRFSLESTFQKLFDDYRSDPTHQRDSYHDALYNLPLVVDEKAPEESAVINRLDVILVFLHMAITAADTSGLAISAYLYTSFLHIDVGISGVIQAAVPAGSFIFGFVWNWLTSFKSYKYPYLLSIFLLLLGNLLYYLAQSTVDYDSTEIQIKGIVVLVCGRLIFGIGGARLMVRKYIAMSIKPWAQTRYSSYFVAVLCVSSCIGSGIQAIIFYAPWAEPAQRQGCRTMAGTEMCWHNMYAFIQVLLWALMFFLFLFFFTGYDKKREEYLATHQFTSVHIFKTLQRLDFKTAIDRLIVRREQRVHPETLKQMPPKSADQSLSESRRKFSEDSFNSGSQPLIVERLEDPFMALVEQSRLDAYNKRSPDAPVTLLTPSAITDKGRIVAIPDRLAWYSQIRYVVFHPASYTLAATFLLFLIKVSSPAVPGMLLHRSPPVVQGLLRQLCPVGRVVLVVVDHLQ